MPDSPSNTPPLQPLPRSSGSAGTIASALFALLVTAIVSHAHQPRQAAAAAPGAGASGLVMTVPASLGDDPSVPPAADVLQDASPEEMAPSF